MKIEEPTCHGQGTTTVVRKPKPLCPDLMATTRRHIELADRVNRRPVPVELFAPRDGQRP